LEKANAAANILLRHWLKSEQKRTDFLAAINLESRNLAHAGGLRGRRALLLTRHGVAQKSSRMLTSSALKTQLVIGKLGKGP
jgi:hypothetical protein